jgi:hypothetical protein
MEVGHSEFILSAPPSTPQETVDSGHNPLFQCVEAGRRDKREMVEEYFFLLLKPK